MAVSSNLVISMIVTMWAAWCVCHDDTTTNSRVLISSERRLVTYLLDRYERYGKEARPRFNSSRVLRVQLGLRLMHLDMDEKKQTMKTSVWERIAWFDSFLKWDPDYYEGLESVILPLEQIWHPDISVMNTASPAKEERKVQVQVKYTGRVFWSPQRVYDSSCLIDLTNYPYDKHTCDMWFQCTSIHSEFVDLQPYYKEPMDISTFLEEYKSSTEWEILENLTRRVREPRQEGVVLMYSRRVSLKFSLTIKRRPGFTSLMITLPCVLLCLMTCVVFCLPPEQPERYTLGMSQFGTFMILLLILNETAPPSAASIPRLAVYYHHNLLLIMSSVFVSILVANISRLGQHGRPVPHYVQLLFFKWLSVPFMMQGMVRIHHLVHDTNTPDSWPHPRETSGMEGEMLDEVVVREISGKSGELSASERRHCHLATEIQRFSSQWRLVALILDRICLCIYLVISVTLIAVFYPVVGL